MVFFLTSILLHVVSEYCLYYFYFLEFIEYFFEGMQRFPKFRYLKNLIRLHRTHLFSRNMHIVHIEYSFYLKTKVTGQQKESADKNGGNPRDIPCASSQESSFTYRLLSVTGLHNQNLCEASQLQGYFKQKLLMRVHVVGGEGWGYNICDHVIKPGWKTVYLYQ